MKRMLTVLLGVLVLVCGAIHSPAQEPAQAKKPARPRIGLVLSGGGALGLCHVGVLQWFEEHRIPIAFVGGTSMGGLVGGLFATGHTAAEMKEFVRSVDWGSVFDPTQPFESLGFRRKEDRREFPNKLQLGLRHGPRLPMSLASGQQVGLTLSRFAAPYAEFRSFDDLPTPFRCVATDLVTGKQVVFKEGSLPTALRATMSIPAVFAPLEVDGMVLVDGGVLNNLPVDVVKAMGADVIIAVTIIDPDVKKETLNSLLTVGRRSVSVMIDSNARRSMTQADLLVSPDLNGLTASDFGKYEEMEQRGYQGAEQKKTFLSLFSVSEEEYAQYKAERGRKRLPKAITPTFFNVRGVEGPREKSIEETLTTDMAGKPFDHEAIDDDLVAIAGLGPYQSASYGFVKEKGADGVRVDVVPKTFAPPMMDTGVNIEGSDAANIRFGMGVRFTSYDLGGPNSELRTDLTIGLNNSVSSEYYRRLGLSRWFVAPRGYYSHRQEDYYEDKTRTSILRVNEVGVGSDFGYAVSRFQEVRIGYQYAHIDPAVTSGTALPGLEQKAGGFQTARFRWVYDRQDSNTIPRHGIYSTMDGDWNFGIPAGQPQYGTLEEKLSAAKEFGPRYIVLSRLMGGTILGPKAYLPPFELGGPGTLSALGLGQLRGERYYYGNMMGLRAFSTDKSSFMNRVYLDLGFEMGKAFSDINSALPVYDGELGIIGESPVGIFFVGASFGSSGNRKFFFRIGRLF